MSRILWRHASRRLDELSASITSRAKFWWRIMAAPIRPRPSLSVRERVVTVKKPGYGSALMGGIAAATGRFIIIGDADDSYDFLELPKLVGKLREGFDLVQAAGFPLGVVQFAPAQCLFYIVGSATQFFPFLPGNGSMRRSTTFTAVCAVLGKPWSDGLTSVAPVWSSRRR